MRWNRFAHAALCTMCIGSVGQSSKGASDEFAYSQFLVVPVRVHLARTATGTAVGTTLTAKDIQRIFGKVNRVWSAAGVAFWIESIVEETPALLPQDASAALPVGPNLLALRQPLNLADGMIHVYYVGRLVPNGVFMARDGIFVMQGARLREAEGGLDEPLPRVTSHELGHALSLPHRQHNTNLMASGTTGTLLNSAEVSQVRDAAGKLAWIISPAALLTRMGDPRNGSFLSRHLLLAAIPGTSPLKDAAIVEVGKAMAAARRVR